MSLPDDMTPHDASPGAATAALRAFRGPLLLDLDETLYLRNSTEDFIDCAYPGIFAAGLMELQDWIRPWRWTGGDATRDVWRVRLIMLLFPWIAMRWRRRVPQLAKEFRNASLIGELREHSSPLFIVTLGFQCIVTPLIAALELGETQVIAMRTSGCADRLRGKLRLANGALGKETVRRSLVITHSSDDLPLLNACTQPLRTVWPLAQSHDALSGVYIPGRYLNWVKRPGERHILRGILQEDFAFWLICSIGLAAVPLFHAIGLLFLLLSFWTIYECGYVDNDRIAAHYEAQPKLSQAFHQQRVATPRWTPWAWALLSGAVAVHLLRWPAAPPPLDFIKWLGVLLLTQGWFHLYNRLNKPTRVWLYPGLQLARGAAFVVLVPIAPVGMLALGAHVLAKWLPYYIYRSGGKDWPDSSIPLTRLLFFSVLLILLALTQGTSALTNWTTAALLGWNLFRARRELYLTVKAAQRLDRTYTPQ